MIKLRSAENSAYLQSFVLQIWSHNNYRINVVKTIILNLLVLIIENRQIEIDKES